MLFETKQDELAQRIYARRGHVTTDPATHEIIFRLFDAEVFTKSLVGNAATNAPTGPPTNAVPQSSTNAPRNGEWSMAFFDEAPPVRLNPANAQTKHEKPKLNEMTFQQLLAERRELREKGMEITPVLVNLHRQVSLDRKSTRLNSSHIPLSRMPSSA